MKYIGSLFILLLPFVIHGQTNIGKAADQLLSKFAIESTSMGASAGILVDGEIKWEGAQGYSDYESKTPFEKSTKTRIASIAKPMTAVAIMQLVEQKRIKLDDLICAYLDGCPSEWNAITIRHLLAHTSGIQGYSNATEAESKDHYSDLENAMSVFKGRPLAFEPGSDFLYTSYGYVVLGRIIESVSGTSYGEYMQKNIWDVANMHHTGIEEYGNVQTHSEVYVKKNKRKSKLAERNDLSNRIPGGGLYSTLEDMLAFGQALVDNKLISNETFDLMLQNQFEEKEGNPYGLGWFFYGQKGYENGVVGHSGEQTGASTQLMIVPGSKTVIVVLSNTSGVWKNVVQLSGELIGISESIQEN